MIAATLEPKDTVLCLKFNGIDAPVDTDHLQDFIPPRDIERMGCARAERAQP
jgi:hypothetical protein